MYVAGSDEAGQTFLEMTHLWDILRPGGVMMGPDFEFAPINEEVQLFYKMKVGVCCCPSITDAGCLWLHTRTCCHARFVLVHVSKRACSAWSEVGKGSVAKRSYH